MIKNIFDLNVTNEVISRIENLKPDTKNLWGKMNVSQMLAHCSVVYEMVYTDLHPKPNFFMKLILKLFVKNGATNEKPYKKNIPTAPFFIMKDDKNFENEKSRLIEYLKKTLELGEVFFDGKESHSFGVLNKTQWNNLFYKHLDHHLNQFGV
jgi:hypothetical protein